MTDALRVSLAVAETLRSFHADGRVHAAVCPQNIVLMDTETAMIGGDADESYLAPEVIAGETPDAAADVFSFGAVAFELFTGQQRQQLASTGSAELDRVVMPCLAEVAGERPRMQRVILDLRLFKVSARRAVRTGNRATKLAARVDVQERALWDVQRSMRDLTTLLRSREPLLRERPVTEWLAERVAMIERTLEVMKRHTNEFEHSLAADLLDIEEALKVHSTSIGAARTSLVGTEDMVERLVKALEALQRAMLDRDQSGDS